MTLKQVAEKIQSDANVRDIEELEFCPDIKDAKKSEKINVLTDPIRERPLKDLKNFTEYSKEKAIFWEFLDRDRPEDKPGYPERLDYPEEYSIKYDLKKKTWNRALHTLFAAADRLRWKKQWLYYRDNSG